MKNQAEERRGFLRVPFDTEVEISAAGETIRTRGAFDISMSGLRLPIGGLLREGTACVVNIFLAAADAGAAIEASGTVIRTTPRGLAVRFEGVDLDGYRHLRQLILNNTGEPEQAEQEFRSHRGIRAPSPRRS